MIVSVTKLKISSSNLHSFNFPDQNFITFNDVFHTHSYRNHIKQLPIFYSATFFVARTFYLIHAPLNMLLEMPHSSSNAKKSRHGVITSKFVYGNICKCFDKTSCDYGIIVQRKNEVIKAIIVEGSHCLESVSLDR